MQIVVPYISEKPWMFDGNTILFHYQILTHDEAIVYFPTTIGSNILLSVSPDILETVIVDYVETYFRRFFGDEKCRDELQKLFLKAPLFEIHHVGTLYTGVVTIQVQLV